MRKQRLTSVLLVVVLVATGGLGVVAEKTPPGQSRVTNCSKWEDGRCVKIRKDRTHKKSKPGNDKNGFKPGSYCANHPRHCKSPAK